MISNILLSESFFMEMIKNMLEVKKSKEFNLKKIYGKNKKTGKYLYDTWLVKYPILNYEDVEKWLIDKIDKFTDESKPPQNFSIQQYLKTLQQYCYYNQVENPNDLLKESIDERNFRLKNYLKFLRDDKSEEKNIKEIGFLRRPSEVTVRNGVQSKIKSFYSARGSPITYNMKSKKVGANIKEITLNKNLIQLIQAKLESANYRLICKFQSQTGLRISDVLEELTSGKYIIEKFEKHYFIRNFETRKRKTIINFVFFTKELTETIRAVTGLNDLTQLDLTTLFLTRHNNRIHRSDFLARLKDIVKELDLDGNIKTHAFRKYYMGRVRESKYSLSDERIVTHFEGHEQNKDTDQAYLRIISDINSYYREWLKTEIVVCVDSVVYDRTNEEIDNLKEKYDKLIESDNQKDKKVQELKEYIVKLEESINKVNEILPNLIESNEFFSNQYNTLLSKISDKEIIESL